MKIKSGFVLRVVGGENVVVPVGELAKTFHGMINLNETGALLWNFYTEDHTVEDGVDALYGEYEVERERAAVDVEKFISIIENNGFAD